MAAVTVQRALLLRDTCTQFKQLQVSYQLKEIKIVSVEIPCVFLSVRRPMLDAKTAALLLSSYASTEKQKVRLSNFFPKNKKENQSIWQMGVDLLLCQVVMSDVELTRDESTYTDAFGQLHSCCLFSSDSAAASRRRSAIHNCLHHRQAISRQHNKGLANRLTIARVRKAWAGGLELVRTVAVYIRLKNKTKPK